MASDDRSGALVCDYRSHAPCIMNRVAAYAVPLFMMQGALLLATAAARNGLDIEKEWTFIRGFALALLLFTLFFYPLLAPLWGRSWQAAEIFGIAPDPTALAIMAATGIIPDEALRRRMAAYVQQL